MKILSIETSCDETAVALLEISGPLEKPNINVLGNTLLSQAKLHAKYGGVYPSLAKREHQKNLPILLEETLKQAHVDTRCPQVDMIAVTAGPGLEPALWTGITFAEELGEKWNKPVLPVNHMEGHIFSVLYGLEKEEKLNLPALALLISGGHTELVHVRDFGSYELIGKTVDDAAGEAFDKVARMLDLPYPGGPKISAIAKEARAEGLPQTISLPRPMINSGNLDFSFSGLKTAVLYKIRDTHSPSPSFKKEISAAFEDAVADVLISKTRQAISGRASDAKTLIIAGGVSSNSYIRYRFKTLIEKFPKINIMLPKDGLATDNAVMIGIAAYIKHSYSRDKNHPSKKITAKGNLSISSQ